jgi:hypothetical protein
MVSSLVDDLMSTVVASINATVANRTNTTSPTFAPTPTITLFTFYTDANYTHIPTSTPTAAPTETVYSNAEHDTKVIACSLAIGVAIVSIVCSIAFGCRRLEPPEPPLMKPPAPLSAIDTGSMSVSVEI